MTIEDSLSVATELVSSIRPQRLRPARAPTRAATGPFTDLEPSPDRDPAARGGRARRRFLRDHPAPRRLRLRAAGRRLRKWSQRGRAGVAAALAGAPASGAWRDAG